MGCLLCVADPLNGISFLFLPLSRSGKSLLPHVESSWGSCPFGSLLCFHPKYTPGLSLWAACTALFTHHCHPLSWCCISDPCTCLPIPSWARRLVSWMFCAETCRWPIGICWMNEWIILGLSLICFIEILRTLYSCGVRFLMFVFLVLLLSFYQEHYPNLRLFSVFNFSNSFSSGSSPQGTWHLEDIQFGSPKTCLCSTIGRA